MTISGSDSQGEHDEDRSRGEESVAQVSIYALYMGFAVSTSNNSFRAMTTLTRTVNMMRMGASARSEWSA